MAAMFLFKHDIFSNTLFYPMYVDHLMNISEVHWAYTNWRKFKIVTLTSRPWVSYLTHPFNLTRPWVSYLTHKNASLYQNLPMYIHLTEHLFQNLPNMWLIETRWTTKWNTIADGWTESVIITRPTI